MTECPNHEGNFDCTPFCALCEGNQEISSEQYCFGCNYVEPVGGFHALADVGLVPVCKECYERVGD